MYRLFKVLFDTLKLPELRAKRGEVVSYSKLLLVSRIIYFCRLTTNESFTVDSSSLKGVLKQYGNTDFNQLEPRVYTGGLRLPKEEGELSRVVFYSLKRGGILPSFVVSDGWSRRPANPSGKASS